MLMSLNNSLSKSRRAMSSPMQHPMITELILVWSPTLDCDINFSFSVFTKRSTTFDGFEGSMPWERFVDGIEVTKIATITRNRKQWIEIKSTHGKEGNSLGWDNTKSMDDVRLAIVRCMNKVV